MHRYQVLMTCKQIFYYGQSSGHLNKQVSNPVFGWSLGPGHKKLSEVTRSYNTLSDVARSYQNLPEVTRSYKKRSEVTRSYQKSQEVVRSYQKLWEIVRGYQNVTEHNELLVQAIPCVTLVNQSKHQSDHVFERKCVWFIICDQVITLFLQLDGSDEI